MESGSTTARGLEGDAQFLKGVGPRGAEQLAKAGIKTVRDLLFYFPRRHEDRRHLPAIRSVVPGQWVTVRGRVTGIEGRPTRRGGKVLIKASISDGTGVITLVWFNQPWIRRKLEAYRGEVIAYGMVKEAQWSVEMHSPEYELIEEDDQGDAFTRIVPVYPLVEGLYQGTVRRAAASALAQYGNLIEDPLPDRLRKTLGYPDLATAIRQMHSPDSMERQEQARSRLVFDEFFVLQLGLAMRRRETGGAEGISFPISKLPAPGLKPEIAAMLPFDLTDAQKRVVKEIFADMERPHPMNRLVQGDVGSGKTAVAACAILAAIRCGYQAAMMAPTEILAEQHAANLRRLFEPLGIEVALLVGKLTPTEKKRARDHTFSGKAGLAIGTHALIQEGVAFERLGLVIVDEQHRFGVMQRAALRDKALGNPDVLVMTATPIPRTLTMTLYGDLDVSVIDQLPPGRKAIRTHWKTPPEREQVWAGVRDLISQGRQAYVVCPMVSESEKMLAQAAEELHLRLQTMIFPDLRIGLLHGQMKSSEKEAVMEAFRRHELDILVSTTVIEVGVDVPNASLMIVEDANRFGLAQLHQLRGRVGRGEHQSFCILIADAGNDEARERLKALVETADGFKIAETDLRLRGPGEVAGTRQSGNLDFKLADLVRDARLLEVSREHAMALIATDPGLNDPQHRLLARRVRESSVKTAVAMVS